MCSLGQIWFITTNLGPAGLEGTWQAVSLEVEGKRQDCDALLDKQPVTAVKWTFQGNKIKIRGGGENFTGV